MISSVRKWGNSLGIRIPKIFLDAINISENDKVDLKQDGDTITIKKSTQNVHRSLEERLVEFYKKPIESIESVDSIGEYDWGPSRGSEEW